MTFLPPSLSFFLNLTLMQGTSQQVTLKKIGIGRNPKKNAIGGKNYIHFSRGKQSVLALFLLGQKWGKTDLQSMTMFLFSFCDVKYVNKLEGKKHTHTREWIQTNTLSKNKFIFQSNAMPFLSFLEHIVFAVYFVRCLLCCCFLALGLLL